MIGAAAVARPCGRPADRQPYMTPKRLTAMTRSRSRRSFSQEAPEGARHTGVVAHDVEAAEAADGEVDQRLDLVRLGHVGPPEGGRLGPGPAASSSPRSSSTSAITTRAPWSTKSSTVARPIPPDPPVTIATLPASSWSIGSCLSVGRRWPPQPVSGDGGSQGPRPWARSGRTGPAGGGAANTILSGGLAAARSAPFRKPRPAASITVKTCHRGPVRPLAGAAGTIAPDTALSYHANHVINPGTRRTPSAMTDIDIDAIDYFRTKDLYDDPYPYFEEVRAAVPGDPGAAPARLHDHRVRRGHRRLPRPGHILELQLGHRALRQVPGPARGRRHHRHHRDLPGRAPLRRPAARLRPAQAHGPARAADAADHAQAA